VGKNPAINWTDTVSAYSATSLTFPVKDKLVAIGGLARLCGSAKDYLAGMWKSQLAQQLMWMPVQARGRSSAYIAPSWSWASMNEPVMFEESLQATSDVRPGCKEGFSSSNTLFSVLDAYTALHGPDPFGRVSGGFIRVSGYPFHIHDSYLPGTRHIIDAIEVEFRRSRDDRMIMPDYRGRPGDVYLPVTQIDGFLLLGLVLEPTNCARGEYKRVGTFRLSGRGVKLQQHLLELVKTFFGENLGQVGEAAVESKSGRSRYNIEESVLLIV
jgi:hypothetical protein